MKLYLLYGDTYDDSYGSNICLFGVFDNMSDLNKAKEKIIKKYLKIKSNYYYDQPYDEDFLKDMFKIKTLNLNKTKDIYLGGYVE